MQLHALQNSSRCVSGQRRGTVLARVQPGGGLPQLKPAQIEEPLTHPNARVEQDVSHNAFANALNASKPAKLRVKGLQEQAAAIWQRRSMPQGGGSALDHVFLEHDTDSDGELDAAEVAGLFGSLGVQVRGVVSCLRVSEGQGRLG